MNFKMFINCAYLLNPGDKVRIGKDDHTVVQVLSPGFLLLEMPLRKYLYFWLYFYTAPFRIMWQRVIKSWLNS